MERKKKFTQEHLPKCLLGLERLLLDNKGGDGFFVGDAVRPDYYIYRT